MKEKIAFRNSIEEILAQFDQRILAYNKDEMWMIHSPYEYLEYYGFSNQLRNTSIALPLARGLHNGTYRKASIMKRGEKFRLPYVIHCLLVCRMLADLHLALPHEEEDILLASALCHDMIEDYPFTENGRELVSKYHLDPRVYETVRLVSKRKGFTEEEERAHFHAIEEDKLALLVKLSDRSQNVEDMYNMKAWKVHEYVDETEKYILPMCRYGMEHYPELRTALEILYDKIKSLTEAAVIMVDRYETRIQELEDELEELKRENARLFQTVAEVWER